MNLSASILSDSLSPPIFVSGACAPSTEYEAAEDRSQYISQLEELNLVGQKLATAESEQSVFNIVATAAERVTGADYVRYVIPHLDEGTCVVFALKGKGLSPSNGQFPLQESSIELTMIRNEPCLFDDLKASPHSDLAAQARQGLKSVISVPVHSRNRICGVLSAATTASWKSPSEAQSLLSTLGSFLESSLQRIRAQKSAMATMEQLSHDSTHDELTKLSNRNHFKKALDLEVKKCARRDRSFAVLFIDLDNFKKVNDTLTHNVGDQLLIQAGQRMLGEVRDRDLVSRLGGDEFVVLLRNIEDQSHAENFADRLLQAVCRPYRIDDKEIVVGSSIGLCMYPNHGETVSELMMHADMAMYAAKRNGRNNCQAFTQLMASEIQEKVSLQDDLEITLAKSNLQFVFQPQMSVDSNCVVGCEALVRWQHPTRGQVSPSKFIPLAEETGLVTQITDMALDQTLKAIAQLREANPKIYGAVNISAIDFADLPKLMSRVQKAFDHHCLPGNALEIELTESVFLEYTAKAKRAIETWKKNGVRLAIDDFGTGFSSLQYLLDLPIDTIKIDQSFVRSLHDQPRQRGVVESIVKMATSLGAVCVAEGVETSAELDCLKDLGCQIYQGYLASHPIPLGEFMRDLRASV